MAQSVAVLIDLDGFLGARAGKGLDDAAADVQLLARGLRRLIGDGRVVAKRAYADLARAAGSGADPDRLARLGLEGVHVRAASRGSGATALRLALDVAALAREVPAPDRFVLCVGDADLTPLLVDLRVRRAAVTVVGVAGRSVLDQRGYCDEFVCFEDLTANCSVGDEDAEAAVLRGAVVEILARRRPLSIGQLADLVCRSLGRPPETIDTSPIGFEQFLRERATEFGIELRGGERGIVLVDLGGDGVPVPPPGRAHGPRHTAAEYRQLLRLRNPRVHLTPRDEWLTISEAFFELAGGAGGERPIVRQQELTDRVIRRCAATGMDSPDKKTQSIVFQLFKCGAFVCAEPGAEGDTDFHWSRPARLSERVVDLGSMRRLARVYIARILIERLQSEFGSSDVDPEAFAEMLEGEGLDDAAVDAIEDLLDEAEEQLGPSLVPHS
ncbi:MAG: NYN domain-containing protein [Planctomycetes bacterium]|nr:NYN domain-containing protein [Planctomycetota bacterium]